MANWHFREAPVTIRDGAGPITISLADPNPYLLAWLPAQVGTSHPDLRRRTAKTVTFSGCDGDDFSTYVRAFSTAASSVKSVPMASSEKRFEVVHEQKSLTEATRILRDRETGVCYLQTWSGSGGGLTVLVEPDGSPVVQHN